MRATVAVLGLVVLGGVATPSAAAERSHPAKEATIARIVALAEIDLGFRRAELGLIGSSLYGGPEAPSTPAAEARASEPAAPVTAATAASPARAATPATAGAVR